MTTLNISVVEVGEVGVEPRTIKISTDASYEALTAAGFISNSNKAIQLTENDIVFALYANNGKAILQPSISNGVVTLTPVIEEANTISLDDGDLNNLPLKFTEAPTTGFYRDPIGGQIVFVVDGTTRFTVQTDGVMIVNSAASPGSVLKIDDQQLLEFPIDGYVVPVGTAIIDGSGLNGDTATADDATIRLVIQLLKGVLNGCMTHGFLAGPLE